jgi:peptide/nickel transport system ATP-binding protein
MNDDIKQGFEVKPLLEVRDLAKYFDVSKPLLTRILEKQPKEILKRSMVCHLKLERARHFLLLGKVGAVSRL